MRIGISCPTVLSEGLESEKNSEMGPEKMESLLRLLRQGDFWLPSRAPGGVTMIVGVIGIDLCALPD